MIAPSHVSSSERTCASNPGSPQNDPQEAKPRVGSGAQAPGEGRPGDSRRRGHERRRPGPLRGRRGGSAGHGRGPRRASQSADSGAQAHRAFVLRQTQRARPCLHGLSRTGERLRERLSDPPAAGARPRRGANHRNYRSGERRVRTDGPPDGVALTRQHSANAPHSSPVGRGLRAPQPA